MSISDKLKILIVDDTPENIDVLMGVLKNDYKMIAALNGEKALKMAEGKYPPDLILLDIMMPGMDGFEVCSRLKAAGATRDIPVIFITAKSETEDETRGLELGAVDFITKPISPPVVRARVRTHLSLMLARQELERQNEELRDAARLREDVEHITRHDLKTPLNAIIGLPDLLTLKGPVNAEQEKIIGMIRESGYKMLNMINRSLDIFKMERGIYLFHPEPADMLQTVSKITVETQDIAWSKRISLKVLLRGAPPVPEDNFIVMAEELLCYSMLANLIKNAIEASPDKEKVTISFSEESDEAVIRIHNKGAVPEDIRDRFFEKYVTSGKTTGTGLGTYSARLMAEIQKGRISMTTSESEGTTVTIRFQGYGSVRENKNL
jgi:two-component system, sensor histidine kinase and response regulator